MKINKAQLFSGVLGALAIALVDQPRRASPAFWESGLVAGGEGHFTIRREGDITLKYVTASMGSKNMDLVPVPHYKNRGPATESVREIARRFGLETKSTVIAAINGGFFDTKTGLPIGFLLRNRRMEFFNMPQGFSRSMVGFSPYGRGEGLARVHISSPQQMPKVWMDTLRVSAQRPAQTAKIPVHHINVPGGKHALSLFTPTYGASLRLPPQAIYMTALPVAHRPGVYQIESRFTQGVVAIPGGGIVVALHGDARAKASIFTKGTLIRPAWSLPPEWAHQEVAHGLLAGPRLLERGSVQVTARQERLDALKSRDRVALGVKANGEMLLVWAHKNTPGNLSFEQMAKILVGMGARDAIALDGGQSRAIFAQKGNAPADDRYFEGGRPVSNALVLAIHPAPSI